MSRRIHALIEWEEFRSIEDGLYGNKTERGGHPNIDFVLMIKIMVLQNWYSLSDKKMERVRWQEGVITHLETSAPSPPRELWIAPPLFDLQINGYAGVDFQQDGLTLADLLQATRRLRAAGCTRYFLTLITEEWHALTARLRHLRVLRAESVGLQSAIAGWHMEGPFLSAEPGFHGAHDPSRMLDPTLEHVLELRSITGRDPLLLTVCP